MEKENKNVVVKKHSCVSLWGSVNACRCKKTVMLNLFQQLHLHHPLFKKEEILNQVQDDNYYRRGFTLIELLVVVLIIGILAAVAVPQYQKAVIKSRFAEARIHLKTLGQARQACLLHTGDPIDTCVTIDKLDVHIGKALSELKFGNTTVILDGFETNDFVYALESDTIGVTYKKDNICLVYHFNTDNWSLSKQSYCYENPEKIPAFDYDKLLGIPYSNYVCC